MKNEGREQKRTRRASKEKKKKRESKYIDADSAAPGYPLRKIGRIDQTDPGDGRTVRVRQALELVTFNWRSWWQLARKLISFKLRQTRATALHLDPRIINYYIGLAKQ